MGGFFGGGVSSGGAGVRRLAIDTTAVTADSTVFVDAFTIDLTQALFGTDGVLRVTSVFSLTPPSANNDQLVIRPTLDGVILDTQQFPEATGIGNLFDQCTLMYNFWLVALGALDAQRWGYSGAFWADNLVGADTTLTVTKTGTAAADFSLGLPVPLTLQIALDADEPDALVTHRFTCVESVLPAT